MADAIEGVDLKALREMFGGATPTAPSNVGNDLKGVDLEGLRDQFSRVEIPPETKQQNGGSSFWQGLQRDPDLSQQYFGGLTSPVIGTAKRIGVGALRGGKDILDTGAEGLSYAATKLGDMALPEEYAAKFRKSRENLVAENKAGREDFDKEYPDSLAVNIGRLGGQIGATIPLMPTRAMQAINSAAGALPTLSATGAKIAAPLTNRLQAAIGTGALGGATLGAATSSTNDKSLGENVGEGLVSGALGGPLVVGAAALGKGVGSKIVGSISPTRAELAKRAEELGIDLKATQVSNSPLLKKYDQISGMFPFSGARGISDQQSGTVNRAISRTFGQDTSELTPKLVKDSLRDIGQKMERTYVSSPTTADHALAQDLIGVKDSAKLLSDVEEKTVGRHIQNILKQIDANGDINGRSFHNLIKYNGDLSKLQQSGNPNLANAGNELRSALEKAFERSSGPDVVKEIRRLKLQYKSGKSIQDLVETDPEGTVSPLKLMRKVINSPGGKLGSGELGEIADIGRAFFPTPADSGTPLGSFILNAIHSPLSAGGAAIGALKSGAAVVDVGLGGVGLVLNRLTRSAINSNATKNAIIRSGLGETEGITNRLAAKAVPYSSELVRDKDPLRITVHSKY